MFDDIRKSISATLYERTTSPLFGTLIISWMFWNWKILYLTFFISESKIETDKIEYILKNCNNDWNLLWLPLISSFLLITVIPLISNGAFWLSIIYNKWKVDKKNEVELSQMLTLEQSILLRNEILEQENQLEKLLSNKELEIKQLKSIIDGKDSKTENSDFVELSEKIKNDNLLLERYKDLVKKIQNSQYFNGDGKNTEIAHLLESYDIIENKGNGVYKYSDKAKDFLKIMSK
jgi:hypothetical protein